MKNESVIKEALIENTTRLIGEGGFEKSTTKAIVYDGISVPGIKLNEAYIYRIFGSKEQLYAEVFSSLDREVAEVVGSVAQIFEQKELVFIDAIREVFDRIWRFLLGNEVKTRCYVRYFYSAYYREKSMREHRKVIDHAAEVFSFAFKSEANVNAIIHESFMIMLDFAVQIYNGDIEDDADNAYPIFNLIYHTWHSYLNPKIVA